MENIEQPTLEVLELLEQSKDNGDEMEMEVDVDDS